MHLFLVCHTLKQTLQQRKQIIRVNTVCFSKNINDEIEVHTLLNCLM